MSNSLNMTGWTFIILKRRCQSSVYKRHKFFILSYRNEELKVWRIVYLSIPFTSFDVRISEGGSILRSIQFSWMLVELKFYRWKKRSSSISSQFSPSRGFRRVSSGSREFHIFAMLRCKAIHSRCLYFPAFVLRGFGRCAIVSRVLVAGENVQEVPRSSKRTRRRLNFVEAGSRSKKGAKKKRGLEWYERDRCQAADVIFFFLVPLLLLLL